MRALAELRGDGVDAHLVLVGDVAFGGKGVRYDNHAYLRELERLVDGLGVARRSALPRPARRRARDAARAGPAPCCPPTRSRSGWSRWRAWRWGRRRWWARTGPAPSWCRTAYRARCRRERPRGLGARPRRAARRPRRTASAWAAGPAAAAPLRDDGPCAGDAGDLRSAPSRRSAAPPAGGGRGRRRGRADLAPARRPPARPGGPRGDLAGCWCSAAPPRSSSAGCSRSRCRRVRVRARRRRDRPLPARPPLGDRAMFALWFVAPGLRRVFGLHHRLRRQRPAVAGAVLGHRRHRRARAAAQTHVPDAIRRILLTAAAGFAIGLPRRARRRPALGGVRLHRVPGRRVRAPCSGMGERDAGCATAPCGRSCCTASR